MIVGISTTSEAMRRFISRVEPVRPVLIGGEPGTGKKFLAENIINTYYRDDDNFYSKIYYAGSKNDKIFTDKALLKEKIVLTDSKDVFDTLSPQVEENIWIPPLRDRIEDIPILVDHFTADTETSEFWHMKEKMTFLLGYWWPYNISELKRVVTSREGINQLPYSKNRIKEIVSHFSVTKIVSIKMETFWDELGSGVNPGKFFHLFLESIEREFIKTALKRCNGSRKETSDLLNIHRNTLNQKIKKYRING